MNVILNGGTIETDATTLDQLIQNLGYGGKKIAAAVNGKFVDNQSYSTLALEDGAEVEIVAPMQGG